MIDIVIKGIVLGIICLAIYMVVSALAAAAGLPAWVALVVGALLILGFCAWLLKVFGISF